MNQPIARKKSPRAPSIALDDAIDRVLRIYEKERCHPAPIDVVAHHIGYKDAKNGAALSVLASLKYYGLVERPKEGMLVVSKDVESFKYSPDEQTKNEAIIKWLKAPPLFLELLTKYQSHLPSDATLKFDLIQRGFTPPGADSCLQVFVRSVEYAKYFEQIPLNPPKELVVDEVVTTAEEDNKPVGAVQAIVTNIPSSATTSTYTAPVVEGVDRIPVRLAGGRRAWIEIPTPFYEADKSRLKAQIDLLLTDEPGME